MRAWTVDADDIQVAEDFNESLLHRTPEIEGFLRSDRDDKCIVIGTKGFGKTLLLKAKRILYQREGRAACLPTGALLDKPIGDKIFTGGFANPDLWSNQAITTELGVNWYWNEYVKLYAFWLHANFADPVQFRPGGFQNSADMFWLRFQLYF